MDKRHIFILLRFLGVVLIGIIGVYFIKILFIYLYPFLIAFILSLLLNPIVTYIEYKWRLSRAVTTLLTIIFFLSLFTFIVFFIGIYIFEETLFILRILPIYINDFIDFGETYINLIISYFNTHILSLFNTLPETQQTVIMKHVHEFLTQFSSSSTHLLNSIILNMTNMLGSLSHTITVTLFIILGLFFITKDFYVIKKMILQHIPFNYLNHLQSIRFHFKKAFVGFFKAQILITSITCLIVFIFLFFYNIEQALTISLFAFFIDFIPYAGIGTIFIPWIIYVFFTGHFKLTIQLTLLYMIVIIIRQLLEPKILASSIGINPLIALVNLFISIKIWGVWGLLISPLILIVISTINHSGLVRLMLNYIKG